MVTTATNSANRILFIFPSAATKIFGSNQGLGVRQEKTLSPPLGILYLATELKEAGYMVDACDFNAEDYSEEKLGRYIADADLVGISMLSFNREHSCQIIDTVNRLRPGLPVIAGGPDCILHPRAIRGTRLTVVHEAENIIVQVVDAVLQGADLSCIPGIVYVDAGGTLRHGAPYVYQENLDRIRFPAREVLRDNKGYSVLGTRRSRLITTLTTSRGCPKQCTFCAHGALAYRKYRARSAANVLLEIEQIAANGYRIVGIVDDNFTAGKDRAMEILQGIIDRKLRLSFAVQGRVDAADLELFRLMRRAGVVAITFGLESGNQDVLNFYNKDATVEQNRRAVELADQAGLYTGGLFILGAPFETRLHFDRTYRFAASLPLDVTSFWNLDYTYGSSLWRKAHQEGRVRTDEWNVPAGRERGTSPYFTQEIQELAQYYFFRYYRRPSYWLRQIGKLFRVRSWYFLNVLVIGIAWLAGRKVLALWMAVKGELLPGTAGSWKNGATQMGARVEDPAARRRNRAVRVKGWALR